MLFGVVGLGGFGLDHNRGVAALVILRLVRDRTNDVTGVESDGSSKCRQGCDEHRDDDFDDFDFGHSACDFEIRCKDNIKKGKWSSHSPLS